MGLLNRRRSAPAAAPSPVTHEAPAPAPEPAAAPAASQYEVIRASMLADVPDWQKLPPMPAALPEMPLVVSQHFDESLVSWRPPELFIEDLGHSVSESAPSGVVEGMAVLTPAPLVPIPEPLPPVAGPVAADELPLTLATPANRDSEPDQDDGPWETTRHIPAVAQPEIVDRHAEWLAAQPEQVEAQAPAADDQPLSEPLPTQAQSEPSVLQPESADTARPEPDVAVSGSDHEPPSEGSPHMGDETQGPVADLVGASPLEPVLRPLTPPAPDVPVSRLTHADTPVDMPLAQLPSTRLPEDQRHRRVAVPGGDDGVEAGPVTIEPPGTEPVAGAGVTGPPPDAGLVGARPIVEPASPSVPPVASQPAVPVNNEEPRIDATAAALPLAASPIARSDPSGEDLVVAPLLGASDPILPGAGDEPASGRTDDVGHGDLASADDRVAVAGEPVPDLPLAQPPSAAAGAEPYATVPLVGHRPPLAADAPPLVPVEVTDPGVGPAEAGPPPPLPASRPTTPRSGLGEPLAGLPSTAVSWDMTRMTRGQQIQASRSLIQSQMAATSTNFGPLPLAGQASDAGAMAGQAGPAQGRRDGRTVSGPSQTVMAGMDLPLAPIENIGPSSLGLTDADVLPAGSEQAPLLSMNPLVMPEQRIQAGPSESAPPPEGVRTRNMIGQRYGVDLSNVQIDRSQEGASEARRLGARAFTSDQGVTVPAHVGSLETGPGQALLAHELTHVAQRARFGTVPPEFTPEGRVLEAEARATEMAFQTGSPSSLPAHESKSGYSAARDPGAGAAVAPAMPLVAAPPPPPDTDALATTILEKLSVLSTPSNMMGATETFTASSYSSEPAPAMVGGGVQRATEVDQTNGSAPAAPPPADSGGGAGLKRPSDEELTNLSRWLYPLISFRLKGELREDRERAGMLTDHYRRW